MCETRPLSEVFQHFSKDPIDTVLDDDIRLIQFAELSDVSLTEEEMEDRLNAIFQENFTIREVKTFMDSKIRQVEGPFLVNFAGIKERLDLYLCDNDKKTLVLIETTLCHLYRMTCSILYDRTPLSIKLPNSLSEGHLKYTTDGVLSPMCINSFVSIEDVAKLFLYAYVTFNFYGALLAYVEQMTVQTNPRNLRCVYYLVRLVFSKTHKQLSNKVFLRDMANIFSVLRIMPDSIRQYWEAKE